MFKDLKSEKYCHNIILPSFDYQYCCCTFQRNCSRSEEWRHFRFCPCRSY